MSQTQLPQTGTVGDQQARSGASRSNSSSRLARTWFADIGPTVVVLAALAAVGYWGHQSNWKMPKFSELLGQTTSDSQAWCAAHDVPEEVCVECRSDLLPPIPTPGWCKLHGVHVCPWCHPRVVQTAQPPAMTAADLERVSKALELKERPENNKGCQFYRRRLQFISVDAMERAGVDIDVAQVRAMIETIDTPAETMYNPSRMARATARVSGTIWRVERDLGEPVRRGDVLAVIDSADVGRAKADFFQALAQVESKSKLLENLRQAGDVVRRREIAEAEAALREARIRLLSAQQALANLGLAARWEDLFGLADELLAERVRSLGLPESLVKAMDGKLTSANLLPVTAPLDGVIVQRQAVAGEPADPESTLFVVSDVQQKWLRLSVRPDDVRLIHVGQEVRFRPDGARLEFKGTVRWISTAVDETTRTVEARAELADPDSRLRAGTFGIGRIVIRDEPKAVVVPNQAIHWDGSCHVVFVRDVHFLREGAPKVFHTRTVRPGTRSDEFTEILAGIAPLEVVAAKGSAVLRAALLKNSLGAG